MNYHTVKDSRRGCVEEKNSFLDVSAAFSYLVCEGWRISISSFYRHRLEGKIRPQSDGSYTLISLKRYAKTFLRRRDVMTLLSKRAAEIIVLVDGDEKKMSDLITWFHRTLR